MGKDWGKKVDRRVLASKMTVDVSKLAWRSKQKMTKGSVKDHNMSQKGQLREECDAFF